jgi:hypothetical protein
MRTPFYFSCTLNMSCFLQDFQKRLGHRTEARQALFHARLLDNDGPTTRVSDLG